MSRVSTKRTAQIILEAVREHRQRQILLDAAATFYIYRVDTGATIARGVQGYEAAKSKANDLRKKLNLKWDQVKFKSERRSSAPTWSSGGRRGRIDTAPNYNPSKRVRFRGVTYPDGSYADLD